MTNTHQIKAKIFLTIHQIPVQMWPQNGVICTMYIIERAKPQSRPSVWSKKMRAPHPHDVKWRKVVWQGPTQRERSNPLPPLKLWSPSLVYLSHVPICPKSVGWDRKRSAFWTWGRQTRPTIKWITLQKKRVPWTKQSPSSARASVIITQTHTILPLIFIKRKSPLLK